MAAISSYRNYAKEAHKLVDDLLQSSVQRLYKEQQSDPPLAQDLPPGVLEAISAEAAWPTSTAFSVDRGLQAIEEFVKSWKIGVGWKYCIDFLSQRDNLYRYAVRWSVPTKECPVPAATASVYFYLIAQEMDVPVLVLYVVEGQRLVHRPEQSVFHEVWLSNVVQNKLAVIEAAHLSLTDCLPSN